MTMPSYTAQASASSHVRRRVEPLQQAYLRNDGPASSRATATLAQLRRLDPMQPADDPSLYDLLFEGMPENLVGHTDDPSRGELAVATSLHLFALHQQGRGSAVHRPGVRFGGAVRTLAFRRGQAGQLDPGVVSRFSLLVHASTIRMTITHLRALVSQMRPLDIELDYGQLAADLFDLQNPQRQSTVHLRWARAFHRAHPTSSTTTETPANTDVEPTTETD
ncbi:type I-E CRISPR-associated protein Cse2/CasB [Propionibacteriaceae bacterium G57]|uniref:type I-E CRISPR-associated protein Cse2/CasB n=1 Tax=Aestuariimicrobium sp. G57 TaxID=3418485 RepID=UPI003DA789BD